MLLVVAWGVTGRRQSRRDHASIPFGIDREAALCWKRDGGAASSILEFESDNPLLEIEVIVSRESISFSEE
jgi:TRAP-type mannitol/chloroaromatic compound transport system substrate-binding protein